jgi:hypothetical protein
MPRTFKMFRRTLFLFALFFGAVVLSPVSQGQAVQDSTQTPKSKPPDTSDPPDSETITAVPNRPTFSTTAETVQDRVFEIEYGLEAADGHQNINGLLKLGATKNLELRFGNNPIERDAGIAGRGDSGAGFKYKVVEEKSWYPTFSVLYTAIIPTSTAGVGISSLGHSAGILVSKDFGKHHFDFNEVAQWLGRPGATGFDRNYFTALAYSHAIRGKWGATAELAGFSRANPATPATMTIMGAATYNVSTRLVLDTGVYFAVYGHLPRATFFSGITYSVADLHHRIAHQSRTTNNQP